MGSKPIKPSLPSEPCPEVASAQAKEDGRRSENARQRDLRPWKRWPKPGGPGVGESVNDQSPQWRIPMGLVYLSTWMVVTFHVYMANVGFAGKYTCNMDVVVIPWIWIYQLCFKHNFKFMTNSQVVQVKQVKRLTCLNWSHGKHSKLWPINKIYASMKGTCIWKSSWKDEISWDKLREKLVFEPSFSGITVY